MVAVKIITASTVSSVIVYLKSKFNNFFRKMESSNDSDIDCCIAMYKKGDDIITFPKAEPNESSLNRRDRQALVKFFESVIIQKHTYTQN